MFRNDAFLSGRRGALEEDERAYKVTQTAQVLMNEEIVGTIGDEWIKMT